MENDEQSWHDFENSSYRNLQRVAKSLNLPSNVKKVYLIQMILAKKYKSEAELNSIIQKVKSERLQLSQVRKNRNRKKSQLQLQGSEVSSTSNSHSPPITQTPKRPNQTVHCSPNFQQAFMNFKSKQSLVDSETNKTSSPKSSSRSDRVLRSCNVKSSNKPYYDVTENEVIYSSVETENKPIYNIGKDSKKTAYSTAWTETNPIISISRAESKHGTIRSDSRPIFKALLSETRPIVRAQNTLNRQEMRVNKQVSPRLNIPRNIIVKKYRPAILSSNANLSVRKSISNHQDVNNQLIKFRKISSPSHSQPKPVIVNNISGVPPKRQRILSGIYPLLSTEQPTKLTYEMVESVGFRHKDGKISKINALVQKSAAKKKICDAVQPVDSIEVTMEDLINCNIDVHANNQSDYVVTEANMTNNTNHNMNITHNYPSMPCLTDVADGNNFFNDVGLDQRDINDTYKESNDSQYSGYYHKKIRGDQVRSLKSHQREEPIGEKLPMINAVFSRFNDCNSNVMQPIYVQVSEESERIQQNPVYAAKATNTNLLENLFNFRSQFIVNQPLLQIATTTNTHCVYSTPTITTAVAQQPGTVVSSAYISSSCEQDDQFQNAEISVLPGICDLLKIAEQDYTRDDQNEELSSCSSLERSVCQNLGANVTIPEMEDALELISQDGDYMERIGMDVRMQCMLCSWAGPRFMLESHIRKEHPDHIIKENKSQWTITFTLGSLVQTQHWICRVLEHDALFVLSVKHDSSDYLLATISTLETETDLPKIASITIYNKVTGEPYSWEGEIQCISPNMPYENDVDGLKLELSRLDLLPNSANLKLLNGELILKSPTKVVVGQPELDDIHVILFVKIFN